MPFALMRDQNIHYDLRTQIVPEDCLFIHDGLASLQWWSPVWSELERRAPSEEYLGKAARLDWPGFGKSQASKKALNFADLAELHIEFAEALKLSEAVLIGHGVGALIALKCLLLAPDDFKKAVLVNPFAVKDSSSSDSKWMATYSQIQRGREDCQAILTNAIHKVSVQDAFFQALVDEAHSISPETCKQLPQLLEGMDLDQQMAQIHHPVLVLHGERDTLSSKQVGQKIAKDLPAATYEEYRGLGHSPQIEDPRVFVESLVAFLGQNC